MINFISSTHKSQRRDTTHLGIYMRKFKVASDNQIRVLTNVSR